MMEDLFLNVTLAALQDRDTGIKTFAKKSVLSKKVKHCFYGAQFSETMRQFGIDDKAKALEIGQRFFDAGYIAPFEAKDRSQSMLQEGVVYFWSEVVVMERKVIETNFGPALNYFLEHTYRRPGATVATNTSNDDLIKSGTGLLKKLRGLVEEPQNPAPPSSPHMSVRRLGASQSGGTTTTVPAAPPPSAPQPSPSPALEQQQQQQQQHHVTHNTPHPITTPDTIEEDTDEIQFFLSPDDPNPVVKAATLEKLIERLTYEAYIDMRFRQQFLITYRSFTTPTVLLEKLRERFHSASATPPTDSVDRTEWERHKKLIHLRVLTVLSRWLTDLFEDWFDPELRAPLLAFLDEVQPTSVAALGNQLRTLYTTKLEQSKADSGEIAVHDNGQGPFSFDDASIPDVAQQLTAFEYHLFTQITRDEVLGLKWSKPGKNERAKNVLRYINHFNRLSSWVVREIITKFNLKQRAQVLLRFVQLAFKFREYNNFSSSMCILAALVSSPVRRLKQTWAELPSEWIERMTSLETLFAHNMSYKTYRDVILKIVPPCIPYLGLYLTDLTFIEEANPDKVDGLINFQKQIMISKVIEDIRRFQAVPYKNFSMNAAVKAWLSTLQGFECDEEAYQLSLKIEPRNAAVTLESMLVEEDRLRKQLHQCEIRISDLESENRRLKEQLSLLDADLRLQIRRGTETADEPPDFSSDKDKRKTGRYASYGSLKLAVKVGAPTTPHESPAAGIQVKDDPSTSKLKSSMDTSTSSAAMGSPMKSRPAIEKTDSSGTPIKSAAVSTTEKLEQSSRPFGKDSISGTPPDSSPVLASTAPATIQTPPPLVAAPAPATTATATTSTAPPSPPTASSPLVAPATPFAAATANAMHAAASAAATCTAHPRSSPGRSAPTAPAPPRFSSVPPISNEPITALTHEASSPRLCNSDSTKPNSPRGPRLSPRNLSPRDNPPPIPPFDFPVGGLGEPPAPPDSPSKAEADLDKPGSRNARILKPPRIEASPTAGGTMRGAAQVSPATQGKKLPPVPPGKKTPTPTSGNV